MRVLLALLSSIGLLTTVLTLHYLLSPNGHAGYVAMGSVLTGMLALASMTWMIFKD